ncbi:MAG: DUF1549 domain-containing protein [Candidatus Hydrogenedentes bacterium]|nr:DUF1549 domain-containing protein [Candidatus Hydrogenedentota bacterium]
MGNHAGSAPRAHLLCWLVVAGLCAHAAADADLDFFEREVRPVLAENCFTCHGAEKQRAGLRLDHIELIRTGGDNGPAVELGNPDSSRLIEAIEYGNVDLQMPPTGKLADEQIAALKQWVAMGAPWPEEPVPTGETSEETFDLEARRQSHWAWQPIQAPPPPPVNNTEWATTDIDRFILAKLEANELTPAPQADRRTLIRRLYFDLIGMPPTAKAVEAFVADASPEAYERLVDELLASPHFGERWARRWMDLTRYAETYGHEQDYPIEHAWRYRDYLIRAFNDDVPYDQIIREHLAGDLLPSPRVNPTDGTNESILATGFWYMHQATHAPVDVRKDEADRIDNQIDVMSKTFLGMTISCARCHDHKFDAISAKDYFGLSGFLRSSRQQFAFLDPNGKIEEAARRIDAVRAEGEELLATAALAKSEGDNDPPESRLADGAGAIRPAMLLAADGHAQVVLTANEAGGNATAAAPKPNELKVDGTCYENFDTGTFNGWTATGHAFGGAPSGPGTWDPCSGPVKAGLAHSGLRGRAFQGVLRSPAFTIEHDQIHIRCAGEKTKVKLIVEGYQLRDYNALLFDGTVIETDSGDEFVWKSMTKGLAKFKGCRAYLEIRDESDGWIAVDAIWFSNHDLPPQGTEGTAATATDDDAVNDALLRWQDGSATIGDAALLRARLRESSLPNDAGVARRLAKLSNDCATIAAQSPAPMRALAIMENSPIDEPVHIRGNPKMPGDVVPRRVPVAIGGADQVPISSGSGRLELADRLLDDSNPLPARVAANRIWQHLFGRGIVPTPDNFGVLGQPPSHPELLDYIANEFRDDGWSVKRMIRRLVMTNTYRMTSDRVNPEFEEKDPANVWLHRMRMRRLEGEAIRDAMLTVAGTLNPQMYGESVPTHLTEFMGGHRRPKQQGPLDGDCRRSIYLEVRRNYLSPMMLAFDTPLPDSTFGQRNTSNVPAQALILMNDAFVVQQAKAWGERIAAQDGSIYERIDALYLDAFARPATDVERVRLRQFIDEQRSLYGLSREDALESPTLWSDVCHVLFTLKEFVFVG